MINNNIIAISGIMGSGKTTLCRNLSRKMGWSCLPEPASAKKYLSDFFKDLNRYAYPTQMAFLCNKSLQILQILEKEQNLIIDRSLYEDIYIFAKCWYDRGNIDIRDYKIYSDLAEFFLEKIPAPKIIIYCECSLAEAKKRINTRDREDQRNFPSNHIEDINRRYTEWIHKHNEIPIYKINTEIFDVRKDQIVSQIIRDIQKIETNRQLSLFEDTVEDEFNSHTILSLVNTGCVETPIFDSSLIFPKQLRNQFDLVHPWVYLAAPFTSVAINESTETDNQMRLLDTSPIHGRIKMGEYRKMLQSIEKNLNHHHIDTLIPHRDINNWGNTIITPEKATANCTESVKNCDIFVGILGESSGTHYELGIAEGLSKPTVVILCDEIQTSFIGRGFINNNKNRLVLKCKKISEIPQLFLQGDFLNFIQRNII